MRTSETTVVSPLLLQDPFTKPLRTVPHTNDGSLSELNQSYYFSSQDLNINLLYDSIIKLVCQHFFLSRMWQAPQMEGK